MTVKLDALNAAPPGVRTEMVPVVAPAGTFAVICDAEATVNEALIPLKLTFDALRKFAPAMVTAVPTGPVVGAKLLIFGAGMTVKMLEVMNVPFVVVTLIGPVEAPAGKVAVMRVEVNVPAELTPLNFTLVKPPKFAPSMITVAPTPPLVGVKLLTFGSCVTLKLAVLVAVPVDVVTVIRPVVALAGTVAVICVTEITVNAALTPLNFTLVTPVKFAPLITIELPVAPLEGARLMMTGVVRTVNALAFVDVPVGVVTVMKPVEAPVGTVAVICVTELTVKTALVPLNLTLVVPLNFVPVMVTAAPIAPLEGVTAVIVGSAGPGTERNAASAMTMP
jgi:hypothetical protein